MVELDIAYRDRVLARQLHAYMYGEILAPPPGITTFLAGGETTVDAPLAPASTILSFGDLSIMRIGEGKH